jgi:predicted kinase
VVLMSGLPGAGKSRWARENLSVPVVTLDDIRAEMGAKASGNQGAVLERAREQARGYLRQGQPFAWNATNLSRELRERLIDLFATYRARVRIVYVEASCRRLWEQNRSRESAVPEAVIERLLSKWEVPDLTEAHRVEFIVA